MKKWILILIMLVVIPVVSAASTTWVDPTPADTDGVFQNYVEINGSITSSTEDLTNVTYNWNGTNYTIFDNSLVLMYNFDNIDLLGESADRFHDSSMQNNGQYAFSSMPKIDQNGKYNSHAQFDGQTSFTQSDNNLVLPANKSFSFSVWAQYNDTNTLNHVIFRDIGSTFYFRKSGSSSHGKWGFYVKNGSGSTISITTYLPPSMNWTYNHHLINYKHDESMLYHYVNSNLTKTQQLNGFAGYNGKFYFGSSSTATFNGSVDEFRMWNRSLTPSEIEMEYMSNLNKVTNSSWAFYVNQTENSTTLLANGTYTYDLCAEDGGGWGCAGERTLLIQPDVFSFLVDAFGEDWVRIMWT